METETVQEQTIDPALENLEPRRVWEIFDDIRRIPRPSKKENKIMEHLTTWALSHGFEFSIDKTGNMCVKVPASQGYENQQPVCLQAHADMVCQAESGSAYNPDTDPIKLKRITKDGKDLLMADGTSLGADNGIGLAAALAIAEDSEAVHPPLQILITVDEEDGLTGATNLDREVLGLTAGHILNLDSETIGVTTVSSAGFQGIDASTSLTRWAPEDVETDDKFIEIKLSGMPGGHSGVNIHENRGNAFIELGKLLEKFGDEVELVLFEGSEHQRPNAIPAEARAVVVVTAGGSEKDLQKAVSEFETELKTKWSNAKVEITEKTPDEIKLGAIKYYTHERVLAVLNQVPNGVIEMSETVPGLVQTSSNLGVVKTSPDAIEMRFAVRSSVNEEMGKVARQIEGVLTANKFESKHGTYMPGWDGDPESDLVKTVGRAYEAVAGAQVKVEGIHAGLETGILVKKIEEALTEFRKIDALSFGPTIHNPHSVDESLEVDTVSVFYKQLKEALRLLAVESVAK